MTCGLLGLAIFHGVATVLETAGKTVPARITIVTFCYDETIHDYNSAYQQFSSQLQQQMSESDFESGSNQLDEQVGGITTCSRADSSKDATDGNTVTIDVDVSRISSSGTSTATHGSIVVVEEGSDWRINGIDTTLDLLPPGT